MSRDRTGNTHHQSKNPVERAERLHKEAGEVLEMIHLAELVKPWGQVTPTGSFLLDVMAYPDLDLLIPQMSIKAFIGIGALMAEMDSVQEVDFQKTHDPSLPGELYLKLSVQYGDWHRPWKVDILSLDAATLSNRIGVMERFCQKITPILRERIIEYKHAVMTSDERTPPASGYLIYRAFLDEGLVEFPDVTAYLDKNGVKIY